jgi:hypothetical protein
MLIALRSLSALALALWLGAMLFFSAAVAPAAFHALPTRELAGNVVNMVLANLHLIAYGCAAALLVTLPLRGLLGQRRLLAAKMAIVAVMLGVALYSGLAVSPPLAEIRATVGTIDKLPEGDPTRDRFNHLHKLSVNLMGLNLLLALALLVTEQLPEKP